VVLTPDNKIAYRGRIDDRYVELGKRRIEPTELSICDFRFCSMIEPALRNGVMPFFQSSSVPTIAGSRE